MDKWRSVKRDFLRCQRESRRPTSLALKMERPNPWLEYLLENSDQTSAPLFVATVHLLIYCRQMSAEIQVLVCQLLQSRREGSPSELIWAKYLALTVHEIIGEKGAGPYTSAVIRILVNDDSPPDPWINKCTDLKRINEAIRAFGKAIRPVRNSEHSVYLARIRNCIAAHHVGETEGNRPFLLWTVSEGRLDDNAYHFLDEELVTLAGDLADAFGELLDELYGLLRTNFNTP